MTLEHNVFCYDRDIDYSFISGNARWTADKSSLMVSHADERFLEDFVGISVTDHWLSPGHFWKGGYLDERDVLAYVLEGELTLSDDGGTKMIVGEGEMVCFSQKDGALYDFYNANDEHILRFLRIGIPAQEDGALGGYERKFVADKGQRRARRLIASQSGRDGSLTLRSDVDVYLVRLNQRRSLRHRLAPGRVAWLQRVTGEFEVNGRAVPRGMALKVSEVENLHIVPTSERAELMLFDMAPSLAA